MKVRGQREEQPEPNPRYDDVKCCERCGIENDVNNSGMCEECNVEIYECMMEDYEREKGIVN